MTLPRFTLEHWFVTAEGRYDLSLSHSDCQPRKISDLFSAEDLQTFAGLSLGYGDFSGLPELRETIAEQYQTISPEQVLTFNGPSEAIYTFMQSVLNPGDKVVCMSPMFFTLHAIARHLGCQMEQWKPRDNYQFHVSDLEALCDESTRLIIINFPHNPTGQMLSEGELRQVIGIAQKSNAMLFCDEVFRLLELPPCETLPSACDLYDKAISVTGMSKPYGMGGLRLGWMATKCEAVWDAVKEYRYYTTETTNTPCQWMANEVLKQRESILAKNIEQLSANLQRLEEFVASHSEMLQLTRPKAGPMAMVRQRTGLPSTELCQKILDEEKLFVVPSELLGMPDDSLRLGMGREDFSEGLERLGAFLNRNF